jgi:hypothetical protein
MHELGHSATVVSYGIPFGDRPVEVEQIHILQSAYKGITDERLNVGRDSQHGNTICIGLGKPSRLVYRPRTHRGNANPDFSGRTSPAVGHMGCTFFVSWGNKVQTSLFTHGLKQDGDAVPADAENLANSLLSKRFNQNLCTSQFIHGRSPFSGW